jgi:hypothetical protein
MPELSSMLALAAAIELGKQGYSCFPCRADKRPVCAHGCNDASTDEADLKALWSEFPGPLIGVATGPPSQICVVDIDRKPEALAWWSTNKANLLPTRAHRTRSGGIHLVYGVLDGLRNSASKIAPGVDVRGDGGYIIWWPAAGCPVLSDSPCARFPSWLEWLIAPLEPPERKISGLKFSSGPHERRARLEGLVKAVLTAPEGNRNACLFWAACIVADMAAELAGPEYAEAIEALHFAARDIGLPDIEIRRTIKSAERRAS